MTNVLWTSTDKTNPGVVCEAEYIPESGQFEVRAKKGEVVHSERFRSNFEPRWGIDVSDQNEIYELAAKLSDKFLEEEKA